MRRRKRIYSEERFVRLRRSLALPARPDNGQEALENAFRARHPTRAATREQAALRAAGRSIAFERLGMRAKVAVIRGSAGGHRGWDGHAHAVYRATPRLGEKATHYPSPATFRGEAIATLCAPAAEELLAGDDLLNSVSLLVAGACFARRAAELEGRDEGAMVREVAAGAVGLVECHGDAVWAVADMLAREKRVDCRDFAARAPFDNLPHGPFVAAPLSAEGQAVCGKIVGALAELRSLGLPPFGMVPVFGEVM
jgi:hypothetical protein